MKNILNSLTIVALSMLLFSSCNKDKKQSKRLSGETYTVTSITVDGAAMMGMPAVSFDECDIYDESCVGHWMASDNSSADFYWQFRDDGDIFEIANSSQTSSTATYEVINYSGVYSVNDDNKNTLEISSSVTTGFMAKQVVIKMTKN